MQIIRSALLLSAAGLSACTPFSSHVSTLGVRLQESEGIPVGRRPAEVTIHESHAEPRFTADEFLPIPYAYQNNGWNQRVVGVAVLDAAPAALRAGETVTVQLEGRTERFEVRASPQSEVVRLHRQYRTGRGYAAQAWQLVAIPVDLALTAGFAALGVVYWVVKPVQMLVSSLRDGDGDDRGADAADAKVESPATGPDAARD